MKIVFVAALLVLGFSGRAIAIDIMDSSIEDSYPICEGDLYPICQKKQPVLPPLPNNSAQPIITIPVMAEEMDIEGIKQSFQDIEPEQNRLDLYRFLLD